MTSLRTPPLAGVAASFAMSALGPVAPDGVLGGLVASSLGVVVYLLAPWPRNVVEPSVPGEMTPRVAVEPLEIEQQKAA